MKIVENKKDCNVPNPVFKIFLFEKIFLFTLPPAQIKVGGVLIIH